MKNILNVLRFEYKGFVSAKSFRVVMIIFIVGILVLTSVPQIMGAFQAMGVGEGRETGQRSKAAVILSGEALTNEIYSTALSPEKLGEKTQYDWVDLSKENPSDAALEEAFRTENYIIAIRFSGGTAYEFFAAGNSMNSLDSVGTLNDIITEIVREVEIAKLPADTQAAVEHISSIAAAPKIVDVGGNAGSNFLIGYVLIMFMLYTIIGYANYVSSSVVTEKTSKAMELLITAVKPLHLMIGKVVGVGLAALTQVSAIVVAFVIGIAINLPYWTKTNSSLLGLMENNNMEISLAVIVVVYFILGFFLYAFLTAAFASTVTRPEEAATVTILPTVLVLVALLVGFLTLFGALSRTAAEVLSFIPFFTPISMLARYTLGDASIAQLLIGVGILVVAIILVATLAAKIFRMGVMLYGVKATPKQLIRALKNS